MGSDFRFAISECILIRNCKFHILHFAICFLHVGFSILGFQFCISSLQFRIMRFSAPVSKPRIVGSDFRFAISAFSYLITIAAFVSVWGTGLHDL